MENNEWKRMYCSLIAAVLFFILMIIASGMDGMSGGYAIMFISFFLIISSFAVAVFFFTRARVMDAILQGKDLFSQWVYPEEETRKSTEREYQEYREANRALLYVVGGFFIIAMLGVIIFGGEAGINTATILLLVLIIICIVSWGAPRLEHKRALNASREAYIAKNGIIYEGAVYPFTSFMMRMDGVRYRNRTDKKPAILGFSFVQLAGSFIVRPFQINIPVPPGKEENARWIADQLGGEGEKEKNHG